MMMMMMKWRSGLFLKMLSDEKGRGERKGSGRKGKGRRISPVEFCQLESSANIGEFGGISTYSVTTTPHD